MPPELPTPDSRLPIPVPTSSFEILITSSLHHLITGEAQLIEQTIRRTPRAASLKTDNDRSRRWSNSHN